MKNIEKVNAIFKNVRKNINSNLITFDGKWAWNLEIQKHSAILYSRYCLTENELNYVFSQIHKYFKNKKIYVTWNKEGLEIWWIHTK